MPKKESIEIHSSSEAGEEAKPRGVFASITLWLKDHGRKLWWIHSLYALGLGVFVVTYAQRGYGYVRWLTLLLFAAWFLLVVTFRLFSKPDDSKPVAAQEHLRALVMNYVLKNLFQAMLFFLLPWYWSSSTSGSVNMWFVVLLGVCAVLATLDVVFDEVLMRRRVLASVYYVVTLFGCLNLTLPAVFTMSSMTTLLCSAALSSAVFWSLLFSIRELIQRKRLVLIALSMMFAMGATWFARRVIPPVPLSIAKGAVGPQLLPDGRLKLEIVNLHHSLMNQMIAVTDVVMPTRTNDTLVHVWRRGDVIINRTRPDVAQVKKGLIRLRSTLAKKHLPPGRVGQWAVDVETTYGQLIGRTEFNVID